MDDHGHLCPNNLWKKQNTTAKRGHVSHVSIVSIFQDYQIMPAAEGMTHMIPNHVLRVGQTIRLDPTPETAGQHVDCGQDDLDISLENLNRIILELDPTFEPIQVDKSPPAGRELLQNLCKDTFFCHFSVSGLLHKKIDNV